MKIIAKSPEETEKIGKALAPLLKKGDLICLYGDLGAGKTLLVQGVARALGVEEYVSSPTFTIIHEYDEGRLPLYHMDVYRIENPEEMEDLGYEEYFYGEGVTFIEWANLIEDILPEELLEIHIKRIPEGRLLEFKARGKEYRDLLEGLEEKCIF